MSKNKKQPRENLQKRNHTKSNGSIQKKNIFQLIEPINKKLKSVDVKTEKALVLAEDLILFLQTYHPEELNKLHFSENDSANNLIVSLIETIIDLKYKIVYNDDNEKDNVTRILYEINFGEWKWSLFDVVMIDKIQSEELKVGYIHFLKVLSPSCYHDATRSDYMNIDDTEYGMDFEMMESEERAYDEEGNYDEGMAQEVNEEVNVELYRLRILKEKFDSYAIQPIDTFMNYIPKNDFEKEFKEFLIKLIGLNYAIINKFHPSENVYNDGGMSFEDSLLIYLDSEIEIGVEVDHFSYMNESANNGVAEPMGWYSIENGIIEQKTTEQDAKDLFHVLHCLEEIYHKFLNKL